MSRSKSSCRLARSAWLLTGCALLAPTPALAASTTRAGSGSSGFEAKVEAPEGFEGLRAARDYLVDLYVNGKRVGEARITGSGSAVRFQDPRSVVALIPNLVSPDRVAAALATDLPANAGLVCSAMKTENCGQLQPPMVGVIFDEDRFRLDLFFAPDLLEARTAAPTGYLDTPEAGLSVASSFGFTLAGSGGDRNYQLQARNVIGLGSGRLRSNAVLASEQGLLVDDMVAELDRPGWRYSGGLFWAPGSDFTGRRRILGLGISTQLDTRVDRELLEGTPLLVSLQKPARVDVMLDGRLVTSRFYEGGNIQLDTSSLPTGSYPLELRIHDGSGPARLERRFFVRSPQMAPIGKPQYFAFAGLMADTRAGRPISLTDALYYRVGTAHRLSRDIGVEAAVTGTNGKLLGETGAVLATRFATVRAVGLLSSKGDRGAIAQVVSGDLGPVSFSFDLRRIHSADGGPLLPAMDSLESFAGGLPDPLQARGGRYTQVSGTAGFNIGKLNLQLLGLFRSDEGGRSTYSLGPSLNWRLIALPGMQLTFTADAQKTSDTLAAFVGARVLVTRGGFSVASTAGAAFRSADARGPAGLRSAGSMSGQWYRQLDENTDLNLIGTLDRTEEKTVAQAGAALQSRFGTARADVLHRFGRSAMEYVVNVQSGGAAGGGAVQLGGRELDESAIIASVDGEGGPFELLVDDVSHGRIEANGSLPLFLRPYHSYQVRLRAVGDKATEYDSGTRTITLYPGNVVQAVWRAEPVLTLFGRALDDAGQPVGTALVEARRGSGQTDEEGWFQVDVGSDSELQLTRADGSSCRIKLPTIDRTRDYQRLGEVKCR